MHFGENQLSPSLIGLSPLPTAHPLRFQPKWVRSSTRSYPRFNLAMGRSLGFGSRARDWIALFGLGFRYYFTPLPGYFSPFPHGTCPLSVTREYSGLAGGPARFTPNFTGSVLLGIRLGRQRVFVYGALTLYGDPFQRPSTNDAVFSLPAPSAEGTEPSHDPDHTTPAGYHMQSV